MLEINTNKYSTNGSMDKFKMISLSSKIFRAVSSLGLTCRYLSSELIVISSLPNDDIAYIGLSNNTYFTLLNRNYTILANILYSRISDIICALKSNYSI